MYEAYYITTEKPSNKNFHLHEHSAYEILVFLKGDASYVVEENFYSLEPEDVIIIKKQQMHRIYHNSSKEYSRFLIMIDPSFFEEFNCKNYETVFLPSVNNKGNKISADIYASSGLKDAILRYKKYTRDFTELYTPVANSIMVEILHIIYSINDFSNEQNKNIYLRKVISHINNHFTENISIDLLSEKFFVSKYHLCKIFKKATGHTIHSYITNKRLALVSELTSNGENLSVASAKAGFSSYSSYYRAYKNKYGIPPGRVPKGFS